MARPKEVPQEAKNLYLELGLESTATLEEIRKAYRRLALRWHPDKNPKYKQEAERRFRAITSAYEVLSDERRRK
ncbi:dnaJsubfamily B member 2-like, partial [Tropilaelaps mercedesae]